LKELYFLSPHFEVKVACISFISSGDYAIENKVSSFFKDIEPLGIDLTFTDTLLLSSNKLSQKFTRFFVASLFDTIFWDK
jgi:hypothetical protein